MNVLLSDEGSTIYCPCNDTWLNDWYYNPVIEYWVSVGGGVEGFLYAISECHQWCIGTPHVLFALCKGSVKGF